MNYALEAGLNPGKDALFLEAKDSPYANILVIRPEDKERPEIKKLIAALKSPEIKKFIQETLDHGVDIGIRILLCYRLAVQLGKSYQVLLTLNNPMSFFQEIISSSCDRKLEIARDIITAYQIENQTINHFLAEEIVAHITQVIEGNF